ncbi:dehydrogenase [Desulfuromonas versatilis]|uniref:Dehydrogenase n=1 Tax=Desulfuromonas versatilis TaxID=2802975 RepID=A0ABM8I297_9BACT|nr:XdhC family protein [Desulfuromonas versatilis]BCR06765.1 dehydrogenase [Desulfuromonas versatilis]
MDDLQIFEEIIRLKKARQAAALALVVQSEGSAPRRAGAKMLVTAEGAVLGTVGGGRIEAETLAAAREVLQSGSPRTLPFSLTEEQGMVCGGRVLVYIEPLRLPPHLVTVGAGHVGQSLSRAARQAGFQATLVDPYPQGSAYRNLGFDSADLVCPAGEVFQRVPVDGETYILVATRNHQDDFAVVRDALGTPARYIGLLGSRKKKAALRSFLEEQGLPAEAFGRIVTPVGLEIGAETPEEIAVSVVAQLVQWRRNHAATGFGDPAGRGALAADGPLQAAAAAR